MYEEEIEEALRGGAWEWRKREVVIARAARRKGRGNRRRSANHGLGERGAEREEEEGEGDGDGEARKAGVGEELVEGVEERNSLRRMIPEKLVEVEEWPRRRNGGEVNRRGVASGGWKKTEGVKEYTPAGSGGRERAGAGIGRDAGEDRDRGTR